MARERSVPAGSQAKVGSSGTGSRPLELAGDSPELVAFALLRYLAQVEQAAEGDKSDFDRIWLLDAYAECLQAVRGERKVAPGVRPKFTATATSSGSAANRRS